MKTTVPDKKVSENARLPFVVRMIAIATVLACSIGSTNVLTYNITGLAWFIPFIYCAAIVVMNLRRVTFPWMIWLPWIILVVTYQVYSVHPSLQRSVQLLCPIAVGMAVSTYLFDESHVAKFIKLCEYLAVAFVIIVLIKSGLLLTGTLPNVTGLAPEVMSGMLIGTIYATGYALGERRYLRWWGIMSVIPIISLTRAAIVATGLTLPFTFGPMKLKKRLFIGATVCLLGAILFYTPRVQHKMFLQGEGEISDIMSSDFADSGRFAMWEHFKLGIKDEPLFGHGVGAGEILARLITFNLSGYPHNDWLLTLYDYGYFGTIIYALSLIVASLHAFRRAAFASKNGRLLFLAGAASFIPFAMLMYTDNIMIYVSFFGNLQFTILGIAYASLDKYKSMNAQLSG